MRKLKNEELDRLSIEAFKETKKLPVSIVLDNIRSMNNIGSAFRTADAFLVSKIYLTGISARPPHREIHKTALGATETVSWVYEASTEALVKRLKSEGKKVYAVEQAEESTLLNDFLPAAEDDFVLIFGNEVKGVSDEVMPLVDGAIEIPQHGTKHSLNISVSVGIVLWAFFAKLTLAEQQAP